VGDHGLTTITYQDRKAWKAHFKTAAVDPFADVEVVPELQPNQARTPQQRATVVDWVVQSLAEADLDYASRAQQAETQDLARPPSIASSSLAANLNEKQHTAFVYAAKTLLYAKKKRLNALGEQPATDTASAAHARGLLRMALQGVAGTGKTHVIRTIQRFAVAWGMPNAVRVVAHTGSPLERITFPCTSSPISLAS